MKRLRVNWKLYLIILVTLIFMVLTFTGVALGKKSQIFKIQDTATFITADGFNHVADHYVNSNFRIYIFATESNGKQLSNPAINTTVTLTFSGPNNRIVSKQVNIVNNYGSEEISFPVAGKWVGEVDAESGKLKHKCEFNIVGTPTLSIVPNTPTIPTGDSLQFSALYSNGAESNPIDVTNSAMWSSNNTVASIGNTTGLATAGPLQGQSLITATYRGLSATTTLDVILPTITLEPSAVSIPVGSQYQFTPVYSDGYTPTTVTWSSSNSNLAPVDLSGNVSGIGIGIFTITALDPDTGVSGTAEITVTPTDSSGFVIEPNYAVILKDSSQQFVAYFVITPTIKIPILNFFLRWSSADSSIATVNRSGLAVGLSGGITTIQASFDFLIFHYTRSALLEVIVPDRIVLTKDKTTIYVGDHAQFRATLVYNGNQMKDITTDSATTWSSDTSAVTISNQGLCTGISAGTSNITAMAYGVSATEPLIVVQPTITIVPSAATIRVGSNYQFTLVYSDGYTPTTVTWSSSNSNLAPVNQSGKVSGIGNGTFIITATDPVTGVSGTATLNVSSPTITIVPSDVTIPVGSNYQFTLAYSAGYSPTTVTWSTSDAVLATVDSTGKVSGQGVGTVTITATDPDIGVSGTATVNVNLPTITIVPGAVTIPVGSNYQFTLVYSAGYIPTTVTWSSNNNNLAPVTSSGEVTGRGSGTFTITATDPVTGISGTALITVTALVTPPNLPPGWGPNWRMEGPYD